MGSYRVNSTHATFFGAGFAWADNEEYTWYLLISPEINPERLPFKNRYNFHEKNKQTTFVMLA